MNGDCLGMKVLRERDRYKAALELIALIPDDRLGIVGKTGLMDLRAAAREALKGPADA